MKQESIYIQDGHHQLHLKHISVINEGIPILLLHGVIENGKIFYTASGKGLACFLATQGFDVYVADFRGRGESLPSLSDDAEHGQYEMIIKDIPLFIDFITTKTQQNLHVICHSWGGVLFSSYLARNPERAQNIRSTIFFGSKRSIYQKTFHKWWKIDIFWHKVAPLLAKKNHYLDAVKLNIGAENESYLFLKQSSQWLKLLPWHDSTDGFEYDIAVQHVRWPKSWHITGINDNILGHQYDVKKFIAESNPEAKFSLLSKEQGNQVDYDHINILTHPLAVDDHFPQVAAFLSKH